MTANIRSIVEAIDDLPVVDQQILAGVFAPSHGEPNIPGVNRRRVPELFSQITDDDVAEAVQAAIEEHDNPGAGFEAIVDGCEEDDCAVNLILGNRYRDTADRHAVARAALVLVERLDDRFDLGSTYDDDPLLTSCTEALEKLVRAYAPAVKST